MTYDYSSPFYLSSVEFFTPFQDEFGDVETMFFKLKYRINKDAFKTRINRQFDRDIQSYVGSRILSDLRLRNCYQKFFSNNGNFFVSAEHRECGQFYDTVTETYAPKDLNNASGGFISISKPPYYDKYAIESVNFYGKETIFDVDLSYNATFTNKVTLAFHDVEESVSVSGLDIVKGDYVIFDRPYKHLTIGTSWLTVAHVRSVAVQAIDNNTIPMSFTWRKIDDSTGEFQDASVDIGELIDQQTTYLGEAPIYAVIYKRVTSPKMESVNVKTRTQFFTEQPPIIERTKIIDSAGNETDVKKSATKISQSEYMTSYNSKYGYVVEDSAITFDKTLGLWRRDVKLANWKYV